MKWRADRQSGDVGNCETFSADSVQAARSGSGMSERLETGLFVAVG